MSEACRKAGIPFPDPLVLHEFNEYQGEAVLERSLPGLLETDQTICGLHAAFQSSSDSAGRRATFQKMFEAVISKWVRGEICPLGVETWLEFAPARISGLTKCNLSAGSRRKGRDFHFRGPHRGCHAARSTALTGKNIKRELDVSEFILERIPLFREQALPLSSFESVTRILAIPRC